jgi:hypothetical protein
MASALSLDPQLDSLLTTFTAVHDARDWDGLRALLVGDFAFVDHRPAGFGTGRSADDYVQLLRTAVELTPDRQILGWEPVEGFSRLVHMRAEATDEFGGPIVWDFLALWDLQDGLARLEVFEVDDRDAATTRAAGLAAPEPSAE